MKQYVVGFVFSLQQQSVLLMRKKRPDWMVDRLNGIGGKVEKGERVNQAMSREFYEEAGVHVNPPDWQHIVSYFGPRGQPEFDIKFFRLFDEYVFEKAFSKTDEMLVRVQVSDIMSLPVVWNLNWIIPMALDPYVDNFQGITERRGAPPNGIMDVWDWWSRQDG